MKKKTKTNKTTKNKTRNNNKKKGKITYKLLSWVRVGFDQGHIHISCKYLSEQIQIFFTPHVTKRPSSLFFFNCHDGVVFKLSQASSKVLRCTYKKGFVEFPIYSMIDQRLSYRTIQDLNLDTFHIYVFLFLHNYLTSTKRVHYHPNITN